MDPSHQKIIGRNHVDKEQDDADRPIKIGSLVKMLHPDTNPLGIVMSYEDDYHVWVNWLDEYSFPIQVQDKDVISEPPEMGDINEAR